MGEGILMYPFQGMIFIYISLASLTPGCLILPSQGKNFHPEGVSHVSQGSAKRAGRQVAACRWPRKQELPRPDSQAGAWEPSS
ncbi:MAG: hypothetical protein DRI57_20495 [Deltaproteobacteria bacterium]|nr:MAG: hypothetical protein DRI57_20495 [Deltaproteobacteria bacterium]